MDKNDTSCLTVSHADTSLEATTKPLPFPAGIAGEVLALAIDNPGEITALGQPMEICVQLANPGSKAISGTVRLGVIAPWREAGEESQPFSLPTNGSAELRFRVIPGEGSYAAIYPVHAWAEFQQEGDALQKAHAVILLSVSPGAVPTPAPMESPVQRAPGVAAGEKESQGDRDARLQRALGAAREAFAGRIADWSWQLKSEAGTTGVAVAAGPGGIADAFIVFADGERTLVFEGFDIEIDGLPLGFAPDALPIAKVDRRVESGRAVLAHEILRGDERIPVQAQVWAEKGAIRVAFSMPGVTRDVAGTPRFTRLMMGAASEKARRVYAGLGNVIQEPGKFEITAGGPSLSTRHVGMDFTNGLSLVQASDIFPDSFVVDSGTRQYSLKTHHDTVFSLVPSLHGAFAAAREYRGIAGFKPAAGVSRILGMMCLDQWAGDYTKTAGEIEKAARYGLTDSMFVRHMWQRWGYDYRLPEIYPPRGNAEEFMTMAAACKRNGILFCPHDNYTDFYPDAEDFSYDHILFNADGTPQKAWYNEGRQAQSYRWKPTAFSPWLERNLKLIKEGIDPDGYFIDVLSAIAPMDFYDSEGRFHAGTVTAERWGAAFDKVREAFGSEAPTISEGGHDALIGHLDAAQSDHSGWSAAVGETHWWEHWKLPAEDGERVPWHDMASHGSFVLLAGGLGDRYATGEDPVLHGYASDDYLCMTVLGGRNPMCDGPFSRRAVMTYWLLHDLCAKLARSEMLSLEFAGDDIHHQTVGFSDGGVAHVNRGASDWRVDGEELPQYGFVARSGDCEVSVAKRDGIVCALARSGEHLFADARPAVSGVSNNVVDFGAVATSGAFRLSFAGSSWTLVPLPDSGPFDIELRLDRLPSPSRLVKKITAIDIDGGTGGSPAFTQEENSVRFKTGEGQFGYRIDFEN